MKPLVPDANILLRAVFGNKVERLIERYKESISFQSPAVCFEEARRYIPEIAARHEGPIDRFFLALDRLQSMIATLESSAFAAFESEAHARIDARDPNDWPIVAAALLLDAPIWTEDQDFFGCGVATWTSDRVELYLRDSVADSAG